MSVEGIIERIITEAREEAARIISEAEEEANRIDEELKKEADKYYDNQLKLIDKKYRNEKERAILNKRLENRKEVLQVRQKWMDEAFNRAYRSLVEQPFENYKNLILTMIDKVSSTKDEEILFGKKGSDAELKSIVDEANKKLNAKFSLSKDRGNFEWGFILKKGKIETNVTIDSLFRYKRDELEQKAWEIFNVAQ